VSPIVEKGLEAITTRTNLGTGLSHPNDMNAAKEMFVMLHQAGEILLANEIEAWAGGHGWKPKDAHELGTLAQQIGMGKKPRIKDGPWWRSDIIDRFNSETGESA
jgi:hypothetical protein